MKYYKDNQNNVYAYELDGSQDHLIGDKVAMTAEEIEAHINPSKTQEQILQQQIAEAQTYLDITDHKFFADYEPKEGEDLEAIRQERSLKRAFIRANDNP